MVKRLLNISGLFLVTLTLSGCSLNPTASLEKKASETIAQKAIENQTGGKVQIDNNGQKITVKGENGETVIGGNEIPSNFPKDVPLYPNAKPASSWSSSAQNNQGVMVSLETTDLKSKVTDYYDKELPKNGWIIETNSKTADGAMYVIKKNNRDGWITISADSNGKTTIALIVGEDKNVPTPTSTE
jgi:hypothetical protein